MILKYPGKDETRSDRPGDLKSVFGDVHRQRVNEAPHWCDDVTDGNAD